jgi:hypothetical protein
MRKNIPTPKETNDSARRKKEKRQKNASGKIRTPADNNGIKVGLQEE